MGNLNLKTYACVLLFLWYKAPTSLCSGKTKINTEIDIFFRNMIVWNANLKSNQFGKQSVLWWTGPADVYTCRLLLIVNKYANTKVDPWLRYKNPKSQVVPRRHCSITDPRSHPLSGKNALRRKSHHMWFQPHVPYFLQVIMLPWVPNTEYGQKCDG